MAKLPRVTTTTGSMSCELALQVGPAGLELVGRGVPVARAAGTSPCWRCSSADGPCPAPRRISRSSSLPDRPTKGSPRQVLVPPGPSPTNTSVGVGVAHAEDHLGPALGQATPGARRRLGRQYVERHRPAWLGHVGIVPGCRGRAAGRTGAGIGGAGPGRGGDPVRAGQRPVAGSRASSQLGGARASPCARTGAARSARPRGSPAASDPGGPRRGQQIVGAHHHRGGQVDPAQPVGHARSRAAAPVSSAIAAGSMAAIIDRVSSTSAGRGVDPERGPGGPGGQVADGGRAPSPGRRPAAGWLGRRRRQRPGRPVTDRAAERRVGRRGHQQQAGHVPGQPGRRGRGRPSGPPCRPSSGRPAAPSGTPRAPSTSTRSSASRSNR